MGTRFLSVHSDCSWFWIVSFCQSMVDLMRKFITSSRIPLHWCQKQNTVAQPDEKCRQHTGNTWEDESSCSSWSSSLSFDNVSELMISMEDLLFSPFRLAASSSESAVFCGNTSRWKSDKRTERARTSSILASLYIDQEKPAIKSYIIHKQKRRKRKVSLNWNLVWIRFPLQVKCIWQVAGACWQTKLAFLDLRSSSFLAKK